MPVTLRLVDHPATEWKGSRVTTSEELLKSACPRQYRRCQKLVQGSFTRAVLESTSVSASENGFIWAAYHAYSNHHHLVIRPEDVWFAVLTQLSFFINANAEELRTFFVAHEGQEELEAISGVADFGALAVQMTELIAKKVIDPELREWVMPSFTTTTVDDKVVGAVLFMGAMQKYFSYCMTVTCGLPSVTLLGDANDWKEMLRRLDKIDLLGQEPRQFARMLRPILHHMVLSFEIPTSAEVTHFWNTIVHRNAVGSGTDYLSGWLTAFCFWSEEGVARGLYRANIQFEDVEFPTVEVDSVPAGFASVPVTVNNMGDVYAATMTAGSVGIAALNSDESLTNRVEGSDVPHRILTDNDTTATMRDVVQPVSGWWICRNEAPEQVNAREAEKKQLQDEINKASIDMGALMKDSDRWKDYMHKLTRLEELEAY